MSTSQKQSLIKALIFFIGYGLLMALAAVIKPMFNDDWSHGGWAYTSTALVFLLTFVAVKYDKKSLRDFDIYLNSKTLLKLFLGVLISAVTFLMIPLSFVLYFDGLEFIKIEGDRGYYILIAVCSYFATACLEGLGNRGYTLKSLTESFGATASIIISAIVFALFHILFGFSAYNILLGVLPMGLVLALAAHVSGGLAFPIGLHATWNICLWIFGNKSTSGLWYAEIAEQHTEAIRTFGTTINLILMLILMFSFWYWGKKNDKFSSRK